MFGAMKGLGDIGKMMKQAKEMQEKMAQMQEDLDRVEVEGRSGAGLVHAVMSAKGDLRKLTIDPSLLDPADAEMVGDLIVAAVADAREKAAVKMQEEMAKVTQGLPPGIFGG
ncbi:YbaB/EbfC family nucleoid-associated protein [Neomegalonema sp.]|uniref:YbaB/EbfC family nucleoid-associated protein n=1 Tax=Neomegalonema sp. TaxID=2039713 RepID=UPI0026018C54|nr:YbaB/EbfC family nucleoid-associated protein [Neomegalonema sp.]MDD2868973.1 YbaB/EbfC family nucleoid-associated protein [Neomegalonema sp.]